MTDKGMNVNDALELLRQKIAERGDKIDQLMGIRDRLNTEIHENHRRIGELKHALADWNVKFTRIAEIVGLPLDSGVEDIVSEVEQWRYIADYRSELVDSYKSENDRLRDVNQDLHNALKQSLHVMCNMEESLDAELGLGRSIQQRDKEGSTPQCITDAREAINRALNMDGLRRE